MAQLRLQHKQWLAAAMIVACCLTLGGMYFVQSLDAFRRANAGLREAGRFNAVLAALNAISLERAPGSAAMTSDVREPEMLAAMWSARARTDRLFRDAERALRGSEDEAELLWSFEEGRARLVRARGLVDEVLAREPEERTDAAIAAAMNGMFMAFESTQFARDRLGQSIVSVEPALSAEVHLAIAASALRDQAGQLGAFTLAALRAGSAADPLRDQRVYATVGRLWAIRDHLRVLSSAESPARSVDDVLWRVDHEFYSVTIPRAVFVYRSARTEGAMKSSAFAETFGAELKKIQQLRGTLQERSYARIVALRERAHEGVLVSAILSILGTAIVIAMSIALRRLLFNPLMTAKRQIAAMAEGDLSDPQEANEHSPEMREMFQGLDSLRGEQRFRRRLEEDQRDMAEQLRTLSETDMLTGLLNRRALERIADARLQRAEWTGEEVGLILFDIDRFKAINDDRGHATGDAVLRMVASGLAMDLPAEAAFARFGGEEFVVLLPGDVAEDAAAIAEHLRVALGRMQVPGHPDLRVTASFGVTVGGGAQALDFGAMLTIADRRLYAAKRAGRDQIRSADHEEYAAAPLLVRSAGTRA